METSVSQSKKWGDSFCIFDTLTVSNSFWCSTAWFSKITGKRESPLLSVIRSEETLAWISMWYLYYSKLKESYSTRVQSSQSTAWLYDLTLAERLIVSVIKFNWRLGAVNFRANSTPGFATHSSFVESSLLSRTDLFASLKLAIEVLGSRSDSTSTFSFSKLSFGTVSTFFFKLSSSFAAFISFSHHLAAS
jgi:hypothetical protein